jgi:hypothetical protein
MVNTSEKATPITQPARVLKRETRQYRLPIETIILIENISMKRSVSKTAVISWAIRDFAEKEGVLK